MLTLDGDGNGEVDFDEFLKVWENFPFQIDLLAVFIKLNLSRNWIKMFRLWQTQKCSSKF